LEYHEIAPGVTIPKIGLGTWGMGGKQIEDRRWDEENITAIRFAIDLGLTHIDTAEYYGAGHTEELVGEAIEPYKYIGVCNYSANLIQEAQSYLKENYLIANQSEYSLISRAPRVNLLPYLQETNRTLIAYSPLGRGILPRMNFKTLTEIAEKYRKTVPQVALNWVVSQENVLAIPKSSNPIHLLEFMDAVGWEMNLEDNIELTNSFI